jgi:hypothetical protein
MHAICTETLQGKAKQGLTLGASHIRMTTLVDNGLQKLEFDFWRLELEG